MSRRAMDRRVPPRPPPAVRSKHVVWRFFHEALARQSVRAADEVVAPDAVVWMPTGCFAGPEGVKRASAQIAAAYPDLRIEVGEPIAEGNRVAVRWTLCGTQRRELGGVPPSGRRTCVAALSLFRIEDGKIVEHWMAEC